MNVVQISFHLDPRRTAEDILRDWWVLTECADMVARTGATVTVIQACIESRTRVHNGISYRFMAPDPGTGSISLSERFAAVLRDLRPDVLHVNGLGFSADTRKLAALMPGTPIFLQDHADRPPRPWRRPAYRRALEVASAISFCALDQAKPFRAARLLPPGVPVFEIPESSSRFQPADRDAARRTTGIHGDPALLWVGHLNRNKDPLTVLSGVAEAVERLPGLQLWCCYGTAPLLAEVQALIRGDSRLQGRVHLLGKVAHERVEQFMQAADLFVSGSHKEGSGCSLVEAMACGLPPAVTDIDSFRALTGAGSVGKLWPRGDAQALCAALIHLAQTPRTPTRASVRAHFDRELSHAAVGRKMVAAYEAARVQADRLSQPRLSCAK